MQAMDWQTVLSRRSRKEPLNAGGWSGFMTSWVSADLLDPIVSAFVGAACDKAAIGWPCDAKLEELRDAFAKTTDPAKRKEYCRAPFRCANRSIRPSPISGSSTSRWPSARP